VLLLNLAVLALGALSLAVLTALIAEMLRPSFAVGGLVFIILADVAVLFLFGRFLLSRMVIRPLRDLSDATERVTGGDLSARATLADTIELAQLGERFNHMTEALQEAQDELVRAEKLATIGRLAAGVAHEVGNPLAAIGTYAEVLRRKGADREVLEALEREVGRIDRIVRGLLAYARPGQQASGTIDLAVTLQTTVALLRAQGTLADAAVSVEIADALPDIRGNAHTVEQMILNLLLNAVDAAPTGPIVLGAMPQTFRPEDRHRRRRSDTESGAIRLRRHWRRPGRRTVPAGTPGVLVWVADGGPGIPDADRERVFDPFFTTKDPGRGTGLGLAIAQGVVDDMGGLVWVEDAREGGAAIKMFLPAATREPSDGPAAEPAS
jgi:signal transduction histidine kinase